MNVTFEEIVEKFKPMIKNQLKKLHIYKDYDTFYQIGLEALWKAYERYDANKGEFAPYAFRTVRGYMLIELEKSSRYGTRFTPVTDDTFSFIEDEQGFFPLEEQIIEEYCKCLNKKETYWVKQTFIHQKKPSEIAKELNINVERVKSWRKTALKKLRNSINIEEI